MKYLSIILLAFLTFSSCKTGKKEVVTYKESVTVKNKADYSQKFINGLEAFKSMGEFELIGNKMILNTTDTIYFPEQPLLHKKITLTAKKGELAIALHIERINQVAIAYMIEMVEFGKSNYTHKGIAEISSGFFLGDETDTNDLTGLAYSSTSFSDLKDECYTYIRLGNEGKTKYLLGKIKKNCNGKIMDFNLDNFLTLIEK